MKIAYLTSMYARAGDTFIRREVAGLRELGHEVHTFSARRAPGEDVSEEIKAEQANTLYLTEQPVLDMVKCTWKRLTKKPVRLMRASASAFKLGQTGVKNRIWQVAYIMEASLLAEEMEARGVEHLHNHIAAASATVALLASEISGIPYSLSIHGPHIFFEPRAQSLGPKVSRSAFTTCITQFCKSQAKIFTPYGDWPRLEIIHCGLDSTFLGQPPTPVADNNKVVTVGRLCEEKGQMELIEVVSELKKQGIDMELVVVGDGPLRTPMEALAGKLGVSDRVDFKGWLGSAEVREAIEGCRLMLHPSFAEGLPVVIMEALALGRPVVASRIAGIPELVVQGESGWLVTPGDTQDTLRALKEALQTPAARLSEMGAAGRARVERDHNIKTETAKLAQLIESRGGHRASA